MGETDLKPGAEALAIGAVEMAFAEQRSANPDWKESRTEVSGRTVVRITAGAEGAVAIWAEPPDVKLVIAYTGTTLDSVLASFVNP
ncbi:MAG TPA: hypothetical protein VFJ71_10685 [Candidatus Limnocylindrales bacterium]|nr:hypothetical protein [Candidatus Limnocylindrales bacterium]